MLQGIILYSSLYMGLFVSVLALLVFFQNRTSFTEHPKTSTMPAVTIIVPAWNEEEHIAETVESLKALDYPEEKREILVVDDGSTDDTAEVAKSCGVRVISKKNGGKASALNLGVDEASSDIVACMDADSIVSPGALKKMVGHFEDSSVGAVTSSMKVENSKSNLLSSMQYIEYLFHIFMRKVLCIMDSIVVTPGPFSLYRKDMVREVGGFDNCNHVEDMDMTFKIHQAGYRIPNVLDAEVSTYCPSTLRGLYNQRMRWYRGLIGTVMKYRTMVLDSRFGNFGMFMLPLSVVSMVLTFLFSIVVFSRLLLKGWDAIMGAYLVDFDIAYLLSKATALPELSILSLNTELLVMVAATSVSAGILYISYRYTGENVRENPAGTIGFLFVYPILLAAFWSIAFIHEIRGTRRKWLHR